MGEAADDYSASQIWLYEIVVKYPTKMSATTSAAGEVKGTFGAGAVKGNWQLNPRLGEQLQELMR